jgi:hypothetical protein
MTRTECYYVHQPRYMPRESRHEDPYGVKPIEVFGVDNKFHQACCLVYMYLPLAPRVQCCKMTVQNQSQQKSQQKSFTPAAFTLWQGRCIADCLNMEPAHTTHECEAHHAWHGDDRRCDERATYLRGASSKHVCHKCFYTTITAHIT